MKERKKYNRKTPKDADRCTSITAKGTRCRGNKLKNLDVCALHSDKADEGRRKGRAVTKSINDEIKAAVSRCNLLTSSNQARFLNLLVVQLYDEDPIKHSRAISQYVGLLIKLTQPVNEVGVIQIHRTITPPS
jgi:hypothetical protein